MVSGFCFGIISLVKIKDKTPGSVLRGSFFDRNQVLVMVSRVKAAAPNLDCAVRNRPFRAGTCCKLDSQPDIYDACRRNSKPVTYGRFAATLGLTSMTPEGVTLSPESATPIFTPHKSFCDCVLSICFLRPIQKINRDLFA
jgi:hypothetical protein